MQEAVKIPISEQTAIYTWHKHLLLLTNLLCYVCRGLGPVNYSYIVQGCFLPLGPSYDCTTTSEATLKVTTNASHDMNNWISFLSIRCLMQYIPWNMQTVLLSSVVEISNKTWTSRLFLGIYKSMIQQYFSSRSQLLLNINSRYLLKSTRTVPRLVKWKQECIRHSIAKHLWNVAIQLFRLLQDSLCFHNSHEKGVMHYQHLSDGAQLFYPRGVYMQRDVWDIKDKWIGCVNSWLNNMFTR